MPRKRTGSLELRDDGYWARVTMDVHGGGTERRWVRLGRVSEARAKSMLAKVAGKASRGELVAGRAELAETFGDIAEKFLATRTKLKFARVERSYYDLHVAKHLAHMRFDEIKLDDLDAVLAAASATLAESTLANVRRLVRRVFRHAHKHEITTRDPSRHLDVPADARVDERPRAVPTDAEFAALVDSPKTQPQLRMMCIASRTFGGLRTADLIAWDWAQIDTDAFAWATAPRTKTGTPTTYDLPAQTAEELRTWWERSGRPTSGRVFLGKDGHPFAFGRHFERELRRDLMRAGVTRHDLHHATPTSRPVAMHSLRRAFVGALARSGVNQQISMKLAGHTTLSQHEKYLHELPEFKRIPEAALPQFGAAIAARNATLVDERHTECGEMQTCAYHATITDDSSSAWKDASGRLSTGSIDPSCRPGFSGDSSRVGDSSCAPGSSTVARGGVAIVVRGLAKATLRGVEGDTAFDSVLAEAVAL